VASSGFGFNSGFNSGFNAGFNTDFNTDFNSGFNVVAPALTLTEGAAVRRGRRLALFVGRTVIFGTRSAS
jgi:hypothetical protein